MADNPVRYGFRAVKSRYGGRLPVERALVATSASFDVNGGASNVVLGEGDVIVQLSTGTVTLAVGSEGTDSATVLGVVCGIKQYLDTATGTMTARGPGIPSDLAWGTDLAKQSIVYYIPIESAIWAAQCDDNTTFTTEAAYQDAIGENITLVNTGASGTNRAAPKLDISENATTNTHPFKIVGISTTAGNQDFSGANVELYVISNGTIASRNAILGI
jgi:hypothetical protein